MKKHTFLFVNKITCFVVLFFACQFNLKSQDYQWINAFGGDGGDKLKGFCSDIEGNIYNIGTFLSSSIDLDPGDG